MRSNSNFSDQVHELAHCVQMNHSKAFWAVRNQYSNELRQLWARNYTGDGFWGCGSTVLSDRYQSTGPPDPGLLPSNLCGGTYRTWRGRKRKRRQADSLISQSTYKERQQKRIAKKFGTNGIALGDDEATRIELEEGRKQKAKPKVASSARGRELRAAAALARLEGGKEELSRPDEKVSRFDQEDQDSSDGDELDPEAEVDLNGANIVDPRGNPMVRVCKEEDDADPEVKREMHELQHLDGVSPSLQSASIEQNIVGRSESSAPTTISQQEPGVDPDNQADLVCSACSLMNKPNSQTCEACSNILQPDHMSGTWRCKNQDCARTAYTNSDDATRCGICGSRKEDQFEVSESDINRSPL